MSRLEAQRLETWLAADPARRAALDEVARTWDAADAVAADSAICEMRQAALQAHGAPGRRLWGAPARWAVAAALLLTLSGIVMFGASRLVPPPPEVQVYRTGVGERAVVTLADGSQATLNTATVLAVDYRPRRRGLRLIAGEAWFDVARNPDRPFVVTAADHQVTAVGTSFNVRLDPGRLRVAVSEGRIKLSDAQSTALAAVTAGQSADLKASGLVLQRGGPVAGDWREGRLTFDGVTLGEAVAEINRYRKTPILVAEPNLERLRISGVFDVGESSDFLRALPLSQPVRVVRAEGSVRIERKKHENNSRSG
nr:FecR domain-containing protein [Brevundimonas sp. SORGH_AS_0993]